MPKRKNVLFFLTDDHGAWASGCYDNSEIQTPTLDTLAKNGTRFANAFTPTPVCSPARACLLTGHTPSQVGIHDWLEEAQDEIGNRDWLGDRKTLFEFFHDAGYYTGLSGKWHLGQSHQAPKGADFHFGLLGWQGIHNHEYTYVKNGDEMLSSQNKSQLITDNAIEFLQQVPSEQPFFLNVGYIATHSPYHKSAHVPELTNLYEDSRFTDIPDYEAHPWAKNEGFNLDAPTQEDLRDYYIGYYAAVTEIDRNIARILATLQDLKLLDDTIIVYTSDHGLTLGHHGFWGKGNSTRPLNMYEYSLRVPLIWQGTDIQGGSVSQFNVTHYDTFQTILDMAGIEPESDQPYPGTSYKHILMQGEQVWDERVFGEYGDLRMIRTNKWKLVRRYPNGPDDLFDLEADPHERNNLIDDIDYIDTIIDLTEQLNDFYQKYEIAAYSGLRVKTLPRHNHYEAWRDGLREKRGLQL